MQSAGGMVIPRSMIYEKAKGVSSLVALTSVEDSRDVLGSEEAVMELGKGSMVELKEMKHEIMCDCDKDPMYRFACKNGVIWFAANVIALKIRR